MEHESLKDISQNSEQFQNDSQILHQTYNLVGPKLKSHKMRGPPKGSKRRPNLAAGIKSGFWNINQMKAYLKFITRFESHFQDKATRKKKKIFYRMSNFIKSRTAEQCRSHHQKLQIKLQTHQRIIYFIKEEIARISDLIRRGLSADDTKFQFQDMNQVKMEDKQIEVKSKSCEKIIDKKTDMKESLPYEVEQVRNGLVITIEEQDIQVW